MRQSRILTVTLNPALDISTRTERVVPELKLRCAPPRSQPGGGGVNVSRAIAHLGGESRAVVAVGGHEGQTLLDQLVAEGLTPLAIRTKGATRISLAVTEERSGQQFRFVLPGSPWSEDDCALMREQITRETRDGDILIASGSLPPGVPPGFMSGLAAGCRGQRVILDSSGEALKIAAQGGGDGHYLDTLRMDDDEASTLAGERLTHPIEIAPLARELVARKAAAVVLIAAGAHGTVMATADGSWLTTPPQVDVVSKVGAGDSFVAAYALSLARGSTRLAACVAGTGAAAAAVETPDSDLCDGPTAELRAGQTTVQSL